MDENFGKITIDNPSDTDMGAYIPVPETAIPAASLSQPRKFGPAKQTIPQLTPEADQRYRMVPLREVLKSLGFYYIQPTPTDEMNLLRSRLLRSGLRLGCYIPGKTTVMLDEPVPLYLEEYGELSTRGTSLVALFMIAWMLQADAITHQAEAIVDQWISSRELSDSPEAAIPALATFHWLIGRKRVMSKARKRRISSLARFHKRREAIITFLLSLMANPDIATPRRMERLRTLYELVGLDPTTIHTDIHRLGVTTSAPLGKKTSPTTIDTTRLKAMAKETEHAQKILSEVFTHDSDSDSPKPLMSEASDDHKSDPLMDILTTLKNRPEWRRSEIECLCQGTGMTIGAMLERLNDLAYDALDAPVAEDDDDTIYIDQEIANQLISEN